MSYFPPGFSTGTGMHWDDDDEEALPNQTHVVNKHFCVEQGHLWVDTGMKWTYCKECDAEGEWDMLHGYQNSSRKRS